MEGLGRKKIPSHLLDVGGVGKRERRYLDRLYEERLRQAGVKPEEKKVTFYPIPKRYSGQAEWF